MYHGTVVRICVDLCTVLKSQVAFILLRESGRLAIGTPLEVEAPSLVAI